MQRLHTVGGTQMACDERIYQQRVCNSVVTRTTHEQMSIARAGLNPPDTGTLQIGHKTH